MTTGDSTWIDALDARLAAGAGAEQLDGGVDEGVAVDPAAWGELWPFDDERRTLTRADVAAVARRGDWPALLRAACIWGHGSAGYGPFRVRRILAGPELTSRLDRAVAVLRDEGAVAAYAELCSGGARIAGLGPAFFTKFLAFAHPVVDPGNPRRALVLDRSVARALVEATLAVLCDGEVEPPDDLEPWAAAVRLWRDPWPPHRYARYLAWAAAVAARTDRTPEEVEVAATALGRRLLRPSAGADRSASP